MFSKEEVVLYGVHGICKIADTITMPFQKETRKYYILNPIYDKGATIYVPIDNEKLINNIKPILTKEQIKELLANIDKIAPPFIEDDLQRKEYCGAVIKKGDRKELIGLIGMLYIHQKELKLNKKHFHILDERFLKEAERLINEEFSYVLGIPKEEVPRYIVNSIENPD